MINNFFVEMVAGWQATPTALGDGNVLCASPRKRAEHGAIANHLVNPSPHQRA